MDPLLARLRTYLSSNNYEKRDDYPDLPAMTKPKNSSSASSSSMTDQQSLQRPSGRACLSR